MKAIPALVASLTISVSRALATGGALEGGRSGLLTECLLALLVVIVLSQFIPGITLLVHTVQGIFAYDKEETHPGPADR